MFVFCYIVRFLYSFPNDITPCLDKWSSRYTPPADAVVVCAHPARRSKKNNKKNIKKAKGTVSLCVFCLSGLRLFLDKKLKERVVYNAL